MKSGIYYGMPDSQYRSAPGISQSELKPILKSPAHFKAGQEEDHEETAATILGTVVGAMLLEPEKPSTWVIRPAKIKLNETAGKDWSREITQWDDDKDGPFPRSANEAIKSKGITVITAEDYDKASRMVTALRDTENENVKQMLNGAKFEVSVFSEIETPNGIVKVKSRPDIIPQAVSICDLKTCRAGDKRGFLNAVLERGYAVQAASYILQWNQQCEPGDEREYFQFLAIESHPPFAHAVYELSPQFMEYGRRQYEKALSLFAYCQKMNEWPGFPTELITLDLPTYLEKELT